MAILENTDCFQIYEELGGVTFLEKSTGKELFFQPGDESAEFLKSYEGFQDAHGDPTNFWNTKTWDACLYELFGSWYS